MKNIYKIIKCDWTRDVQDERTIILFQHCKIPTLLNSLSYNEICLAIFSLISCQI